MSPLTVENRVQGKAAMEKSLTPAARARRRFKSGRPTKIKSVRLSPLDAIARAVNEYQKLQGLMRDEAEKAGEEFDFKATKAGLVYCTSECEAHTAWLPSASDGIPAFGTAILSLTPLQPEFLGVIFYQCDPHAKRPAEQHIFWVLQFVTGPAAEKHLFAERDRARRAPLALGMN